MINKKILWAINVYSRVNHLRIQEELIRKEYGDLFTISVHTGNEMYDKFPDSSFQYKENKLTRIPDDPSVHTKHGSNHGGSHNGDRDIYNRVKNELDDYDYVIMTAADCIFSDYSVVKKLLNKMINGNHKFMSCYRKIGTGRGNHGPYVDNEFWVMESEFYKKSFPMQTELEGYDENEQLTLCMERGLGELVQKNLEKDSDWLVIPAVRHEHERYMEVDGIGEYCLDNRFLGTLEFMKKFSPKNFDHVINVCFPNGFLHDIRPNYEN